MVAHRSAGRGLFIIGEAMTDYHPLDPAAPGQEDTTPKSLESEQALLGMLMLSNEVFAVVDGHVAARDFHEPFHQRLFKAIGEDCRHGRLAEPAILATYFSIDPAFHEFGGISYLADLVDKAPPTTFALDYCRAIRSTALRRETIRICRDIQDRATADANASGAELMADLERELLAVRAGKDDLAFQSWAEVSRGVVYGMDRPDETPLLKLGLKKVDHLLGGCEPGELLVLGGRPGMGKSALAAVIARLTADGGGGVAEINAEMTVQQMARRHLTDYAFERFGYEAPQYRDIKRGTLSDRQKEIIATVQHETAERPLMMVKRTGLTLGRIRAMLNRQKMLWEAMGIPLRLVVIDHVGLVSPDQGGRSRNEDQTVVSGRLKELADELGVVMMALAQLNRQVEMREDKRPMLADLRDSGSWEQDADVVIGTYRDAYYARREKEPKSELKLAEHMARASSPIIEAIGLKVREGEPGTAKLWASIGHNAIRDEPPSFEDSFASYGAAPPLL